MGVANVTRVMWRQLILFLKQLQALLSVQEMFVKELIAGDLALTGYIGDVLDWITSIDNGLTWVSTSNTSTNQPYFNLTQTTWYRAIVQSGSCTIDSTGIEIINVELSTVSGLLSGGALFCGNTGTGTFTLTGNIGNILNWESSTDEGSTWNTIANISNTESYTGLTQSSLYRVIVQNGSCERDTSNVDTVSIVPQTVAGSILKDTTVCPLENQFDLELVGHIGSVLFWEVNDGLGWKNCK